MCDVNKGLIAWFARNKIAANLLMVFILVGGYLTSITINKQLYPQHESKWIEYRATYPGAAPQEVEEGITLKLEQAVKSIEGLDRVITKSQRNRAEASFRVASSYNVQEVFEEVKSHLDAIPSFPEGMEKPLIYRKKRQQDVLYISLYGDVSTKELKALGLQIHKEIQELPRVKISKFNSGEPYEVSIEVSKDKLREYQLTINNVAQAIRDYSRNMSAGQIRSDSGYINLRIENQAYHENDFANIPVLTLPDGRIVFLDQVATINDSYIDGIQYSKFNGQNSTTFFIGARENQNIIDIATDIKKFIKQKNKTLPHGVKLESWVDMTSYLEERLDMMLDNMKSGAILVFILLTLFLRIRLAFWVMVGLPVCFLGTLFLMPLEMINTSINVISLFGFILVLGIVVDDAIVIGESADAEIEAHGHSTENVIRGVKKVAMPATFGVLTTIAAFVPLIISEGHNSAFNQSIGFVVILCLIFSLIESKLILPAHIANMAVKPINHNSPLEKIRNKIDSGLKIFIYNYYRPTLNKCIDYRYSVLTLFLSALLICVGLFNGGYIRYIGTPDIPHDFPKITLDMNDDSSAESTLQNTLLIQKMIENTDKEIEASFGEKMLSDMQVDLVRRTSSEITVKLVDPSFRVMNTFELANIWRTKMPNLPGVQEIRIQDSTFINNQNDGDISFKLQGNDKQQLLAVVAELKNQLDSLDGVNEVNDSWSSSTQEITFTLKPLAHSLGLSLTSIANQMNNSFYGLEAQRIIRGTEESKVMVRYPREQRSSPELVEEVLIKTPSGIVLPLTEVANIHISQGFNEIRRENGSRTVNVWANVNTDKVSPRKVARDIKKNYIPNLLKSYPLVKASVSGKIQDEIDNANKRQRDFIITLMVIFILLAIPLKSYSQPLMVMTVIPFGFFGAIIGHMLLGLDLNNLSIFGIIAASGVVINDSLVMISHINDQREKEVSMKDSVISSGVKRFRAILLTSLTTFVGLIPIIFFETSLQAQIVVPMAVSLSFGVLFATLVTLIFIPSLYVISEDIKKIKDQFFTTVNKGYAL